jgi:hypothetical protein
MSPITPESWCSGGCLQPSAHAGSSFADISILNTETVRYSETSGHIRPTRYHIQEYGIHQQKYMFCAEISLYFLFHFWGTFAKLLLRNPESSEIHLYRQQPSGELLNSYCKFEQILMIENIHVEIVTSLKTYDFVGNFETNK